MVRKVEEVSRLSGISKRTLQYYDDEGILPAKRSKENYRLYDEVAMEKLWEILWYKEMGVQLSEIKEILVMPKKEREEYFEQKVKSIGEKIQDLEEQRKFVRHIEKYGKEIPEFTYRLKVKGGLTGYAQVYGKYNTTALDKLKMDLLYIVNYSILVDFQILFETVKIIFQKESTEGFTEEQKQKLENENNAH